MATEPAVSTAPPEGGAGGQAPPGGKPAKGKTIAGLPAPVAIAGLIAFVVAGGYFLLHRQSASSSGSTAGDSTAGGAAAAPDDSAALSDIEQQLADLNGSLGQLGAGSGAGGSDGGGGLTGTTGDGGGTGDGTGTGTGTGTGGGTGGNPLDKLHQATVGGKGATRDLYQIAKDNGITEAELIRLNPQLKKYEGSKKPIPKRQKIIV